MSTGTTTDTKTKTPVHPITWMSLAGVVIALVMGFIQQVKTEPKTDPPVINVHPVINVEPPAPAPQPKPAPTPAPKVDPVVPVVVVPPVVEPVVVPVPSPDLLNSLTIKDINGNPLTNAVEPNRMFYVTAASGVTLTPVPSADDDADIEEDYCKNSAGVVSATINKLRVVLRNDFKLQVIVTGAGRPVIVMIQCNHGPQPPPNPDPKPTPVDPVVPIVSKDLRVLIVEDVDKRSSLTSDQMAMLTGKVTRDWFKANCVKDSKGDPQFRIVNKTEKLTGEWVSMANETPTKLPWMFIQNGPAKSSAPLSETFEGLKPLLDRFSGVTP